MGDHLQQVADYVTGDDNSELAKIRAELAYALHCLEREIAICADTQKKNGALVKALEGIAEFCSADAGPLGAIDRLTSIRNTALNVLASVGGSRDA